MAKFAIGWRCNCSTRVHKLTTEAVDDIAARENFMAGAVSVCSSARVVTCEEVNLTGDYCDCSHPEAVWGNVTRTWWCLDCTLDIRGDGLDGCSLCGNDYKVGEAFRVWKSQRGVVSCHQSCWLEQHPTSTYRSTRWPLIAHSKVFHFPAGVIRTVGV